MHRKCYKAQGHAIDHKNDLDGKNLFILIKLPPSVMLLVQEDICTQVCDIIQIIQNSPPRTCRFITFDEQRGNNFPMTSPAKGEF